MIDAPQSAGLVALAERIEAVAMGRLRACHIAICFAESLVPWKPSVHRPAGVRSAAAVKRELDRLRPSATRRGYGARWRRARAGYLARHPLCVPCREGGRLEPSTTVDHIVPHRGDQKLFWDEANWAAMCKRCHDTKTAREGRWG